MAIKIKYPCLHETAGEKQQQVSKLHIMCNQKTISAMREKKAEKLERHTLLLQNSFHYNLFE